MLVNQRYRPFDTERNAAHREHRSIARAAWSWWRRVGRRNRRKPHRARMCWSINYRALPSRAAQKHALLPPPAIDDDSFDLRIPSRRCAFRYRRLAITHRSISSHAQAPFAPISKFRCKKARLCPARRQPQLSSPSHSRPTALMLKRRELRNRATTAEMLEHRSRLARRSASCARKAAADWSASTVHAIDRETSPRVVAQPPPNGAVRAHGTSPSYDDVLRHASTSLACTTSCLSHASNAGSTDRLRGTSSPAPSVAARVRRQSTYLLSRQSASRLPRARCAPRCVSLGEYCDDRGMPDPRHLPAATSSSKELLRLRFQTRPRAGSSATDVPLKVPRSLHQRRHLAAAPHYCRTSNRRRCATAIARANGRTQGLCSNNPRGCHSKQSPLVLECCETLADVPVHPSCDSASSLPARYVGNTTTGLSAPDQPTQLLVSFARDICFTTGVAAATRQLFCSTVAAA